MPQIQGAKPTPAQAGRFSVRFDIEIEPAVFYALLNPGIDPVGLALASLRDAVDPNCDEEDNPLTFRVVSRLEISDGVSTWSKPCRADASEEDEG